MKLEHGTPREIEGESMRIIGQELEAMGIVLPAGCEAVVKRAIHTTADFDYARNLCFTPGAVEAGVAALRAGPALVTHTNMALSGVNRGACEQLGVERSRAALERAEQNEGEVTRLSERYGVVGVHMFCPSTPDAAAHCRNFAPLYAIPEEAATGTSNGALTYYLYRRGLTAAGAENRFVQGEKMGKPSEILSRLTDGGDGVKVQVGGRAVLALRCDLL